MLTVREVGLKLDGPPVGINSQINQTLFVVNARHVPVYDGMRRTQVERPQIRSHGPVSPQKRTAIVTNVIRTA